MLQLSIIFIIALVSGKYRLQIPLAGEKGYLERLVNKRETKCERPNSEFLDQFSL